MEFPVYDMQAILSKAVMDWVAEQAAQHTVHPTVVLNALLMYGLYELTHQGAEGLAKLQEFIHTLHASTPIREEQPWESKPARPMALHPRILAQVNAWAPGMHLPAGSLQRCNVCTHHPATVGEICARTPRLGGTYGGSERPHAGPLGDHMTIRQLRAILETMDPDGDAFVALFNTDGSADTFAIEDVTDKDGDAQIEIALIGFRGLMLQHGPRSAPPYLRPLKKKGFKEERMTTIGLDDIGTSTTLESNKSLSLLVQWHGFQPHASGFVPLSMAESSL